MKWRCYCTNKCDGYFFRIGVLAYNLFIGFKRLFCPESWVNQTIATFRWKMVQVAGRIVKHAGETVLKLMMDLEKLELFRGIRKKSFELSLCLEWWNKRRWWEGVRPREEFAQNLRNPRLRGNRIRWNARIQGPPQRSPDFLIKKFP